VWIRSDLACSRVTQYTLPSSVEAIVLRIPRIKLLLLSAYVPPNLNVSTSNDISEFFTFVMDSELSLCPDLKVMVCGDFNTFDTQIFEQCFSLYNCVKAPTRQTSFLDQIWISCNLRDFYKDEAVIGPPLDSSDHQTVFLFSNQSFCKVKNIVKLWDFRHSNIDRFLYLLSITNFSSVLESDSVDELCQEFYGHLHVAMSFIPSRYVILSTSDKPWITPLLKHLINERWKAFRNRNWKLYHHYKDKVKQEIKKAKMAWARRQIKSSKHIWKVVSEIRGSKQHYNLQTLINDHGSKEGLLEAIQGELEKNFNRQEDDKLLSFEDEKWEPMFTNLDVFYLLSHLDLRKSTGSDGVPARLLREGALYLSSPVFRIFSQSITTRRFPACWKLADVTPVPKCKNPSVKDFRPISLTPVLSKLLESLVLKSMSPELFPLFGASQHAFRKHGSTESALVKIHDCVTEYLDVPNVNAVRMTCLDLSKAFDRVLHNKLINRLISCNINRGFVSWLIDFLLNRVQRLKLGNIFGPVHCVPSGIPQGSILGPTLFSCFMGSLSVSSDSTIVLYADDLTLVEPIRDLARPNNLLDILEWVDFQRMSLNLDKSKQIIFYRRLAGDVAYPSVPVVSELKILGVSWNDKLSWDGHFREIFKAASQRLFVIRTLKSVLTVKELIIVYHSLISSLFLYVSPLFVSLPLKIADKIQSFQNRAHRIICGKGCGCSNFPSLASVRMSRASNFLKKCELFSTHPLHHLIPPRMPRSSHFQLPHIASTRRLRSFVPSMCIAMNNEMK